MENFVHDSLETQAIRQRMCCNMPTGFSNPIRSNQTRTISMRNHIMKNRNFEYLPTARRSGQFSKAVIPQSRQSPHYQNAYPTPDVESLSDRNVKPTQYAILADLFHSPTNVL